MKVKGSVISTLKNYINKNYSDRYNEWFKKLDAPSREIFSKVILATDWYPIEEGIVNPSRLAADLFFNGDYQKAGWELGRFSAEEALTGIYKVFVMIATPQFIMKRGSKILSSFYDPSKLAVSAERTRGVDISISDFEKLDTILENRIGGWMEKALEICGCHNVNTEIVESLTKGNERTLYQINWE